MISVITGLRKRLDSAETRQRLLPFILLFIALVVSLCLRLSAKDHLLFWDEADNLLQMQDLAGSWNVKEVQLWHPPLYIFLGALLQRLLGFREQQMILLSIYLGLSTMVLMFLLTRRLSGDRIAVLTVFAMAVSPQLNYFGSWIKQDLLMAPLVVAAMLLFVNSHWFVAAVIFALSLLTKEPAGLFLVIVTIYAAVTKVQSGKRLLMMNLTALVLSVWWYLGFGDYIVRLTQMATGASAESQLWSEPFYFFIKRIPGDMTWTTTALFLAGIASIILRRNKHDFLPVLWFALSYLALMFTVGKSPWFALPFVPAIAWISAIGADRIIERLNQRARVLAVYFICLLGILMLVETETIGGYQGFIGHTRISLQYSRQLYQTADNLNTTYLGDDRVAMPFKNPILMWLIGLTSSQVFDLPHDPSKIRQFIAANKITRVMIWQDQAYTAEINKMLLNMVQKGELPAPFYDKYMIIYETKDIVSSDDA